MKWWKARIDDILTQCEALAIQANLAKADNVQNFCELSRTVVEMEDRIADKVLEKSHGYVERIHQLEKDKTDLANQRDGHKANANAVRDLLAKTEKALAEEKAKVLALKRELSAAQLKAHDLCEEVDRLQNHVRENRNTPDNLYRRSI